jgi:hypothetical protein
MLLPAVVWTCHTAFPADKLGDISRRYYGEEGSARKPLEVLGAERVSQRGIKGLILQHAPFSLCQLHEN